MDIAEFNRGFEVRLTRFEPLCPQDDMHLYRMGFTIVHSDTGRAMQTTDVVGAKEPGLSEPSNALIESAWLNISCTVRTWASRVVAGEPDHLDAAPDALQSL